jgi:hypothetical protein
VWAGVQPAGSAAVRERGAAPEELDESVVTADVVTVAVVAVVTVGAAELVVLDEPPDPQAAASTAVAMAAIAPPQRGIDIPMPRADQVSPLKFGSPSDWIQWLTVTFSWVNSPVQIRTPIVIRTAPPSPITTG